MKRLSLLTLALALLPGLALAQNITKSLQGSQDPRGPVGVDISNSAYFPNHINGFGNTSTFPSVAAGTCGTGAVLTTGSTDVAGNFLTRGVSCAVTFGSPFNAPPACVISNGNTAATSVNAIPTTSTSTVSASYTQLVSGQIYTYICIGNQ